MRNTKALRTGVVTAVLAVVAWRLLPFVLVLGLRLFKTFEVNHGRVVFMDTTWTFVGFGPFEPVELAQDLLVATLGFAGGLLLARWKQLRPLR